MALNPVTLEIIKGGIESAIHEMEILIDRTAMSPIIKEKKDYFIGVYDVAGRMVAAHISFTGPGLLDPLLRAYPLAEMAPGDVFWFNDPYFTGGAIQHLGDMCFARPVFFDGQVVAFAVCFGHFRDIGGTRPGSVSPGATEIFHEGTRIPPIRIYHKGSLNREAYAVILANSRFPGELEGDTKAMMAASGLGEARLLELFRKYGRTTLLEAFDQLIEGTARASKARFLELIPEGEYHFFDYADGDGHTGRAYRIDMRLVRQGDDVVVDLTGSDDQARGPINFITTNGFINLLFGRYLMAVCPDLLLNEGLLHNVRETLRREGTIVFPRFPGAVGLRSHTRLRLSSCMLGVLGQATRGHAPANSPVYVLYTIRSLDPKTGKFDLMSEGVGAGLGARPFADGVNAIYFIAQRNFPIEFIEDEHPIRVEAFGINPDSGGPGYYRGGCGIIRDIRILQPEACIGTRLDNVRFACWGANGGYASGTGKFLLNPGTPQERELPPIGEDIPLKEGDLLRVMTGGGGGWGDPFTRPVEWVQADVAQGFVSLESARRDYGVALAPDTWEIDRDETAHLRARPRPPRPAFDRGPSYERFARELVSGR